jgi:hypothetical protein
MKNNLLVLKPHLNGAGGRALLVGDCSAAGAECPGGFASVIADVEDNADGGAGADVFLIAFCANLPTLPPGFNELPAACIPFEGGVLRTGNTQIR